VGGGVTVIDGDDLTFYAAELDMGGAMAVYDIAFDRDGGTWLATIPGLPIAWFTLAALEILVVVIMVILTTLLTPPILTMLLKRQAAREA